MRNSKRTVAKNRADQYRQRAQECLDLARTLSFGAKRQVLTDMAQTWLELAEEPILLWSVRIKTDSVIFQEYASTITDNGTAPGVGG
jgi:hypothetical protein